MNRREWKKRRRRIYGRKSHGKLFLILFIILFLVIVGCTAYVMNKNLWNIGGREKIEKLDSTMLQSKQMKKTAYVFWNKNKKNPKKVYFAGDSLMKGLEEYGMLKKIHSPGRKGVVAYEGLGTRTFQTNRVFRGKTAVEKIVSDKPDRVYIMLGINEINYRKLDDVLKNYTQIINKIQDGSPQTEIVLLAAGPVSKKELKQKKGFSRIGEWNGKLEELAKKEGCRYFDYTEKFKDSDGYLKYDVGDGVHWTIKGYKQFVAQINSYEKKINKAEE